MYEVRCEAYVSAYPSLMEDDERQKCGDRAHDESAAPRIFRVQVLRHPSRLSETGEVRVSY